MTRDEDQMRIERKIADFTAYARMKRAHEKVPTTPMLMKIHAARETTIKRMEAKYPDFPHSYEVFCRE